jgi:predicted Zn finger-like uncharacterized protein
MLIHCDQCHSKYKITIKKIPSKPVNFRCGKCQKTILISPEELRQDLNSPAEPESKSLGARVPPPSQSLGARVPPPASAAAEPAEASQTDTVQLTCLKCGASFVKHKDDKARFCYQCRIDQIVTKIKDKYGVTQEVELPEAKSKYSLRSPDGLVLGPIRLKTVAVLVREKRLKGQEEVSKDGAEFQPLAEFEELRKLFPNLSPPAPKPAEEYEEEIPLDLEETPPALGAQVPPPEPALGAQARPASSGMTPPAPAAPPAPENVSRYKIRYPDGLVLGPIRLLAVEDLVAAGNLTGQEEVQKDHGDWKPFLDYPELKRLMASGEEIAEGEVVELTDLLEET